MTHYKTGHKAEELQPSPLNEKKRLRKELLERVEKERRERLRERKRT